MHKNEAMQRSPENQKKNSNQKEKKSEIKTVKPCNNGDCGEKNFRA